MDYHNTPFLDISGIEDSATVTEAIDNADMRETDYDSVYDSTAYAMTPAGDFGDADEVITKTLEEQRNIDGVNGALFNFDYLLDGSDGSLGFLGSVNPEEIQPQPVYFVAPATVQYSDSILPDNIAGHNNVEFVTPATGKSLPTRSSRRKSGQARNDSESPVFESMDMKPSETVLQREAFGTRGKKRSQTVPSPVGSKRIKKYELDDHDNPSVRNARAAKANREKKKQQVVDLTAENQQLREENTALKADKVKLTETCRKWEMLCRKTVAQQQSANGILQVKPDLFNYLACLVPALGQSGVPVPSITLAPGFIQPEPGTRSITTQYNIDTKEMTVSCPVVPAWAPGQMPPQQ